MQQPVAALAEPITLTHPATGQVWVAETPIGVHDALARGFVAQPTEPPEPAEPAAAPPAETPAPDSAAAAPVDKPVAKASARRTPADETTK